MRRAALAILLLIGLGLIIAPLAMSMFPRADKGEQIQNGEIFKRRAAAGDGGAAIEIDQRDGVPSSVPAGA